MLGGVTLVAAIYVLISVALILGGPTGVGSDQAPVTMAGSGLFGVATSRVLAAVVVTAVAGSLGAVLLGAPRVYLAMARDGVFPPGLLRFNQSRRTAPGATMVQVALASVLVLLGNFNEILGFF